MAPTQQQITVALHALRADAGVWHEDSATLHTAAESAAGLVLGIDELSLICEDTGIVSIYAEVRQKLARLLGEASMYEQHISQQLTAAANGYEADDRSGAHKLKNVY